VQLMPLGLEALIDKRFQRIDNFFEIVVHR
jgi:hypothetical protein